MVVAHPGMVAHPPKAKEVAGASQKGLKRLREERFHNGDSNVSVILFISLARMVLAHYGSCALRKSLMETTVLSSFFFYIIYGSLDFSSTIWYTL